MNTCYVARSSRPAGLFSFGLLDRLPVRLRRPHVREAPAGFGLERLATAFMNNPGLRLACLDAIFTRVVHGSHLIPVNAHYANANLWNQLHRPILLRDGHPAHPTRPAHET